MKSVSIFKTKPITALASLRHSYHKLLCYIFLNIRQYNFLKFKKKKTLSAFETLLKSAGRAGDTVD